MRGGRGLRAGVERRYADRQSPYPGAFVSVAEPVGFFAASPVRCAPALIHVVMTAKPVPDGLIDAAAFRFTCWQNVFQVSGGQPHFMVVIQAAHDTGVGPARPRWLRGTTFSEHAGGIVAAICALAVATAPYVHCRSAMLCCFGPLCLPSSPPR